MSAPTTAVTDRLWLPAGDCKPRALESMLSSGIHGLLTSNTRNNQLWPLQYMRAGLLEQTMARPFGPIAVRRNPIAARLIRPGA
jgi:hypothetical protein